MTYIAFKELSKNGEPIQIRMEAHGQGRGLQQTGQTPLIRDGIAWYVLWPPWPGPEPPATPAGLR